MRWLPVVALVGCAAPESAVPARGSAEDVRSVSPVVVAPADAGVIAPDAASALTWTLSTTSVLSAPPASKAVITANHGASITTVAVSEDGRVAATADGQSVRLWPSLDGKREPVVVAMRQPLALAVVRDGDAVVVAGLDAIGQLELVRTTGEGVQSARLDVASPRPIRAIWATGIGVLALRDDGGIALYELSGALRGELAPTPRQHVRTLAVRNDRALAIVEGDGKVRGEWIEVDAHGLHVGAETPRLPTPVDDVVLSPDHQRIGMTVLGSVLTIEVATAKVVGRYEDENTFGRLHVDGFEDSENLAFDKNGLLGEVDTADEPNWRDNSIAGQVFAVGDHLVVGVDFALLTIAKKGESAQFLGYNMMGPVGIVPRGAGFLASTNATLFDLGPDLRVRRTFELGTHSGPLQNPMFVDGDHVITAFAYGYDNPQGEYLADVKSGAVTPIGDGFATYNFETGVLIMRRDRVLTIRRYDRKKYELGEPFDMDIAQGAQTMWLAPTRGDFAVVTVNGDSQDVQIDIVRVGDKPEIIKSKRVSPGDDWFINQDIQTLFDESWKPHPRRQSPDRSLVAEVHDGRMTLRDATGAERWMVAAAGIDDVTWTARGELVAFGAGIARVDLATGALRERQCGWQFGLWPERPNSSFTLLGSSTLCEAP